VWSPRIHRGALADQRFGLGRAQREELTDLDGPAVSFECTECSYVFYVVTLLCSVPGSLDRPTPIIIITMDSASLRVCPPGGITNEQT